MARRPTESEVNEFAQSVGQLVRRMRSEVPETELSLSESSVLARLANEGPQTTASLARAESVKPQSMGSTIAALEGRGLVRRRPHPTDGRQQLIELTGNGATLFQARRKARRGWLADAITELSEEDQKTLFRAAEVIRRLAGRAE